MQTRLSPLEGIHRQELASGKKEGEAMVTVGGGAQACELGVWVSTGTGTKQERGWRLV